MSLRSYIKTLFLLSTLGVTVVMANTGTMPSKNIIFDLGEVLIKTNGLTAFWHLGPLKIVHYPLVAQNSLQAKKRFFAFLEAIAPYDITQTPVYDADGTQLPQLMYNWLTGAQSCQEITQYITHALKQNDTYCASKAESQFFQAMTGMIFNPETFVKTRKVIKKGIDFVHECKARGHRVYILSNWDSESFELMCRKYPALFLLFDGIMISGNVRCAKPDPAIFSHFLTTFDLNPAECIFIDDQQENVRAARTLGIKAVLCPQKRSTFGRSKPNYKALRDAVL